MKALVIEDEKEIALTIKDMLAQYYNVEIASNGEEGVYLAQTKDYDIILLDLVLPDIDGTVICKKLRKESITSPILVITGQSEVKKKVLALDAGADDYILKPFNSEELLARIRAVSRRSSQTSPQNTLSVEDLTLDLTSNTVTRNKKTIHLRRKELHLLEYLIKNKGRV